MVQREHRVRLAAAEVGLQLDDRIPAPAGQALDAADEKPLQTLREIRPAEEFGGVSVLVRALSEVDLPQVGGELRLLIAAACDIGVRSHDFSPGLQ